jgi:hypothetical protein
MLYGSVEILTCIYVLNLCVKFGFLFMAILRLRLFCFETGLEVYPIELKLEFLKALVLALMFWLNFCLFNVMVYSCSSDLCWFKKESLRLFLIG